MNGTFLRTSALRIAASFLCDIKGGLNKGFYSSKSFQSRFSPVIGHSLACHKESIYTYHIHVN